jgi:hypothetical protein
MRAPGLDTIEQALNQYARIDLGWHIKNRVLAQDNWHPPALWCRHNAGECKHSAGRRLCHHQHRCHSAGG